MQPGLLPEEYEDDSVGAEAAREDAGEVSRTPAEQLEPIPTGPQIAHSREDMENIPTAEKPDGGAQQSSTSSDLGANQRAAGADKADEAEAAAGGAAAGGAAAGSKLAARLKGVATKAVKKRLAILGVTGLLGIGGVLGFGWLAEHELVAVESDVVHAVDKRLDNQIGKRLGPHFKDLFKQAGAEEGDSDTGEPISDAYHNFSMDQFKADMDIASIDYGANGDVIAFTLNDGSRLSVNDDTLDDPNSPLMQHINDRFPEMDFMRDDIQTRIEDSDFGIERHFLAPEDEPVSSDSATLDQQVDQDFTSTEEGTNGSGGAASNESSDAEQDLEGDVQVGQESTNGAIGPAGYVLTTCGAIGISEGIHKDSWIIRVFQLMHISNGITLPTGDQEKKGDLHASQLGALMKLFVGFAKSGGWKVLTGVKGASVSSKEQSEFSANPSGDVATITGALDNSTLTSTCNPINSTLHSAGPLAYFVPATLDLAEGALLPVAGTEEAAGEAALEGVGEEVSTNTLQTLGSSAAQNYVMSKLFSYLAGFATKLATKPMLSVATMSGADLMDATISGYDNYGSIRDANLGGGVASGAQVQAANQSADAADLQAAQQKGLAYQLFSPDYGRSLASDLILKTPTSADAVAGGFNSALAVITSPFNRTQLAAIGSFISDHIPDVQAAAPAPTTGLSTDPLGWNVTPHLIPAALFQEFPDPEANEAWITNYLCSQPGENGDRPGLYDGACNGGGNSASELLDQNDGHYDPYHDYVRECFIGNSTPGGTPDPNTIADDPNCSLSTHGPPGGPANLYDRFRVYRFDLALANMNTSFNNSNDDQNPNPGTDSSGSSGSGTTTPATPISASAQQAAQDLLSNSKVSKSGRLVTQDLQDAAAGKNGSADAPVNPLLLQALATLAQSHSFDISAIESGGTGHCFNSSGVSQPKSACPTDPHYQGDAADIDIYDGASLDGSNAASNQLENDLAQILPANSRFGMAKYSGYGTVSIDGKTFYTFNDGPNHVHFDVLGVSSGQ